MSASSSIPPSGSPARHDPGRGDGASSAAWPAHAIVVSEVSFSAAPLHTRHEGLLGWVAFLIDGWLRVECSLRRTQREGRLSLVYPGRRGRSGTLHYAARPVCDAARRHVEREVFRALAQEIGA